MRKYDGSGLSDMYDEYRIKDEILLDQVIGISIPFTSIVSNLGDYKWFFLDLYDSFRRKGNDGYKKRLINVRTFYNNIVSILDSNGISLPIYDIDANLEVNSELDIGKVKKKRK